MGNIDYSALLHIGAKDLATEKKTLETVKHGCLTLSISLHLVIDTVQCQQGGLQGADLYRLFRLSYQY